MSDPRKTVTLGPFDLGEATLSDPFVLPDEVPEPLPVSAPADQEAPERWEDLPLAAQREIAYERSVCVVAIEDVVPGYHLTSGSSGGYQALPGVDDLLSAASRAGWRAVIDAENELVCLVPPAPIVSGRNLPDALAQVVAAVLNGGAR